MMLCKLKSIHRFQSGFTAIEIVVAVALASIIGTAAITATLQLVNWNNGSMDYASANSQVQSASYWISQDAQTADSVLTTAPDGFPLQLAWTDWDNRQNVITYTLEDMESGLKELQRSHVIDGSPNTVVIVAEHIDGDETSAVWDDSSDKLTVTITVTLGAGSSQEISKSEICEIHPRLGQ